MSKAELAGKESAQIRAISFCLSTLLDFLVIEAWLLMMFAGAVAVDFCDVDGVVAVISVAVCCYH